MISLGLAGRAPSFRDPESRSGPGLRITAKKICILFPNSFAKQSTVHRIAPLASPNAHLNFYPF